MPGYEAHVDKNDANGALKHDLRTLGIRVEAGQCRKRGGLDMRPWFMTRLIEDGADSLLVRRFTHAEPRDLVAGYQRLGWSTYCREVEKLNFTPRSARGPVSLGTALGTAPEGYGPRHGHYWRNGWRRFVEAPGVEGAVIFEEIAV